MDGGPVETSRGFVLHTLDYQHNSTVEVSDNLGLTASVDILNAINDGQGPNRYVIALGCSAWSGGQLEEEFLENTWLNVPAMKRCCSIWIALNSGVHQSQNWASIWFAPRNRG